MEKTIYPVITDASLIPLRAIEVQLQQNPGYLDAADCPYAPSVVQSLKRLCDIDSRVASSSDYSEDDLLGEIVGLYKELKDINISSDVKDNIAMLKARGDLLTKVMSLKERALNARDMAKFQKKVVEILETVFTPAQRNEFLEILNKNV